MILNPKKIAISVDFKKYRIRIYKQTLALLGLPKYIQLLINPEKLIVAINPLEIEHPNDQSHKIDLRKLKDDTYEIYSYTLTKKIGELCPNLETNKSYRFIGQFNEEKNFAIFSLKTANLI